MSKKSDFLLVLCLFLDDTFSKTERDGKHFRKRCQNFTSRILPADYMRISLAVVCV